MSGFMGFYTMFLRVPFIVKFVAVGSFILCFFSISPSVSFTQYIVVVFCCYFYILCLSIKDYTFIYRCLQCLLLFNLFFFLIQITHNDSLLNFGNSGQVTNYGIIGYRMQSASFITILSAALIPFFPVNIVTPFVTSAICNSAGSFASVSVGLICYLEKKIDRKTLVKLSAFLFFMFSLWMVLTGKLIQNLNMEMTGGRFIVWIKSLQLSWQHPFTGFGIATYKGVFPALSGVTGIPWRTAHNSWVQLIVETGYLFSSVMFGYFVYILIKLLKLAKRKIIREQALKCTVGFLIIGMEMQFHFPERMIQAVLIIIFFLAYCQKVIYDGGRENGSGQSNSCEPCAG